jgi:hypothetical protein
MTICLHLSETSKKFSVNFDISVLTWCQSVRLPCQSSIGPVLREAQIGHCPLYQKGSLYKKYAHYKKSHKIFTFYMKCCST